MKKIIGFFFIFITTVSIWVFIFRENKDNYLKVHFLDVGQGDSILIEAPNNNQILIDTGSNKKVLESIRKVIPIYDKKIDALLLTHPDLDHIGGTVPLFNVFDIRYLFLASSTKETEVTNEINKIKTSEKVYLNRGDKLFLDLENDIYLEVLFPDFNFLKESVDINDQSIVVKLVFKEVCFLLTGDVSKTVEKYLVANYQSGLDCDVLKAGHHGSNTSTSEEFVGFVSPEYGIISSGKENKFGHPHKEVLDVFKKFNVEVLNTADLGNISFRSNGEEVVLVEN